jgi:hypothetical protein
MKTFHRILVLTGLLGATGIALAQNASQLPPECSDRNNPNPEKCVIQDGPPPRDPWVHSVPPNPALKPVPLPVPPTAPAQSPPSNFAPPKR